MSDILWGTPWLEWSEGSDIHLDQASAARGVLFSLFLGTCLWLFVGWYLLH